MRNHAEAILACDFFVTITATFRTLYVFVVLDVGTRRIVHWNVTEHPTAEWTVQQFRGIVPGDQPQRFLIHDRDSIYSAAVDDAVRAMGLTVLKTPVRCPQANAFCERLIGTIRRECLDWLIVLNERHLRCVLREWVASLQPRPPTPASGLVFPTYRVMRPGSRRMAIESPTAIASSRFRFWRGCTTNTGWNQKPRDLSTAINIFADDKAVLWMARHCLAREAGRIESLRLLASAGILARRRRDQVTWWLTARGGLPWRYTHLTERGTRIRNSTSATPMFASSSNCPTNQTSASSTPRVSAPALASSDVPSAARSAPAGANG